MIDLRGKTLLILAPHPDDEVIGCAGLMQRVSQAGGKVYVIYFTAGTTQDFGRKTASRAPERVQEIKRVARKFKVTGWRLALAGEEYHLQLDRVAQKDLIHEIERGQDISLETTKPNILALPWAGDYNQDHRAVALAALTAMRPAPRTDKWVPEMALTYETPMNQWSFEAMTPNFFVTLTAAQMRKKVKGMAMYGSQVRRENHPRSGESLEALNRLRGTMAGCQFAEAYVSNRLVV